MPATFPSHAAAVLPLKLWRPRWFDGVALVVGSAISDMPYVTGCCTAPQEAGHTWWGALVAVPVIVVLARLVRWAAPEVAAHLPMLGPFALRDYAVLGVVRHRWWVSAASALLGIASHLVWDHVTHAPIPGTGMGLAVLAREASAGVPWWMVAHLASSIAGAAAYVALSLYIGRRRLLVRWHGPVLATPRRPLLFWSAVAVAAGIGLLVVAVLALTGDRHAMVSFLPPLPSPVVVIARLLAVGALALVAGAAAVRLGVRGNAHNAAPIGERW